MHQDLRRAPSGRALSIYRLRIAGTALAGLAAVAWWLARLSGLWQGG